MLSQRSSRGQVVPVRVRTPLLVLAVLLGAGGAAWGDGGPPGNELATDLRGTSGEEGYRILNLEKSLGFRRFQSVTYILDPQLRVLESPCYDPVRSEGKPGEGTAVSSMARHPELQHLLKKSKRGEMRVVLLVDEIIGDFFRLVTDKVIPRKELLEVLKEHGARRSELTRDLVTVSVRFRVRSFPDKSDKGDGAVPAHLECEVQLRTFKIKVAPIEDSDPSLTALANLTYCEQIFEDTAVGRVNLEAFSGRPEDAVRAAIIDALKGRLAVNFCMNPRLNRSNLAQELTNDICGVSISDYD